MSLKKAEGLLIAILMIATTGLGQPQDQHIAALPYRNTSLSVDERIVDLLSRMTLREKLGQLFNESPAIERLGIPKYNWWNEGLHGVARAGTATVFPQAIGLSATFNEDLMLRIATAISDEARAKHTFFLHQGVHSIYTGLTFWSPNINIFRDPRWGRGQETYGEDPFLTGRMAVNFIRGLQGNDPRYLKTIATAKHYAVHSGPEFSRHQDNVFVNDRDLYETYLPAFRAAVKEGHVQSVMCAYNRFRDQPCCGSNLLLSHILREELGFAGYIVSDCGAISDFYIRGAHHIVETPERAWGWSLSSGTDVNCEESKAFLPDNVDSAVQAGIINEKDVNTSLGRLLRARFMLGMFDPEDQVGYNKIPLSIVGGQLHEALNLQAAEQSLVLLKNNGVLPLDKSRKVRGVALIGPNADNQDILLGNYNGQPVHPVTPLEALQQRLGKENVFYSPGCAIVTGMYTNASMISAKQLWHREKGRLRPGLRAEYYANTVLSGSPAMVRTESAIVAHWPRSPLNGKIEDSFSVRWTGVLIPAVTGSYTFRGNVALKINGQPVRVGCLRLAGGKKYELEATLVVEPFWWGNTIEPTASLMWIDTSRDYQQEALDAASKADVIVFCGGISSQLEGEEMPLEIDGFGHGDRTDINLPSVQEALLKKLKKTGKKIVYVNFSGSAIALNWENENLDAILQDFYPGETGGIALVNTLFGDNNPSGRLPVTFYRTVDDLPAFKDYSMKGRTYRYFEGEPLYPFGYGLSYTQFSYRHAVLPSTLAGGSPLEVSVDVTNTGSVAGGEIVELYIAHKDRTYSHALRSLAGFARTFLNPGETRTIKLTVSGDQLSVLDDKLNRIVEPGEIDVFIGGCMPDKICIGQGKVLHSTVTILK